MRIRVKSRMMMRRRSRRKNRRRSRRRSVLEKAKGWGRELFHVILICDGFTLLLKLHRAIVGA